MIEEETINRDAEPAAGEPENMESLQSPEASSDMESAGMEEQSEAMSDARSQTVSIEEDASPEMTSEEQVASAPLKRTRKRKEKAPIKREKRERPKRVQPPMFQRFVMITWSGRREPVDDMYWAEAEREGDWIVIREFEQVRSRKEILDRLQELPNGLVAVDFNLSYPKEFVEFLKAEAKVEDWRSLAKKVREDLKKNADDGIRLWIERMGKYRESNLDPVPPMNVRRGNDRGSSGDRRGRFPNDRFADERRVEPLPPYEQPSLAERYRRTDLALKRVAEQHLVSPIQIGYNRLTNRYEFNDTNARGRSALIGISMLDQLLDARPEVAVWPIMRPKPLTIVELLPWTYTSGKTMEPDRLRKMLSVHEDNGWDIPEHAIDLAARNADAQRTLLCLMGLIKTETRENRERRPIRDYVDAFYEDPQVKLEGWFYSIGYRVSDDRTSPKPVEDGQRPAAGKRPRKVDAPATQGEENLIVAEQPADVTEQLPAPEAAAVSSAE